MHEKQNWSLSGWCRFVRQVQAASVTTPLMLSERLTAAASACSTGRQTEANAENAFRVQSTDVRWSHWFSAGHAVLRGQQQASVCRTVFISSWAWGLLCVFECTHTHTHRAVIKHWPCGQPHTALFFPVNVCVCVCVRAQASFPIHRPFCVGVCQRCCLQAGPHCVEPLLLIDTGPLALRVPMAPQPQRTEGWNRSPGPGESLFALPFLSPGAPGSSCGLDVKNLRWEEVIMWSQLQLSTPGPPIVQVWSVCVCVCAVLTCRPFRCPL